MEYLIIAALQIIGIGLHAFQKIGELDKKYPDLPAKGVINAFWEEDWYTIGVSVLVLLANELFHYIISDYTDLETSVTYYFLYAFGLSFLLGYAGQRLVYKYLGTAEKFLEKKVNEKV